MTDKLPESVESRKVKTPENALDALIATGREVQELQAKLGDANRRIASLSTEYAEKEAEIARREAGAGDVAQVIADLQARWQLLMDAEPRNTEIDTGLLGQLRAEERDMLSRAIRALEQQKPELETCNCRWKGDEQVLQCELHQAHIRAIHEWAERAKTAEKKLAEQQKPAEQASVEVPREMVEQWMMTILTDDPVTYSQRLANRAAAWGRANPVAAHQPAPEPEKQHPPFTCFKCFATGGYNAMRPVRQGYVCFDCMMLEQDQPAPAVKERTCLACVADMPACDEYEIYRADIDCCRRCDHERDCHEGQGDE